MGRRLGVLDAAPEMLTALPASGGALTADISSRSQRLFAAHALSFSCC